MNSQDDLIIPTKENPVFIAECDYFGYIDGIWKQYQITLRDGGTSTGQTFALYYQDAIIALHDYLKRTEVLDMYPKAKFNIYLIDGSLDKTYDETKLQKVYTISAKNAKRLLF